MKKNILLILMIASSIFIAKSQSQEYGPLFFVDQTTQNYSYTTSNGDVIELSFFCDQTESRINLYSASDTENLYEANFKFYSNDNPSGFFPEVWTNSHIETGWGVIQTGSTVEAIMSYDNTSDFTAVIDIIDTQNYSKICTFSMDIVYRWDYITNQYGKSIAWCVN